MSRKRVPLNQNECTADFGIGVPFEQNLQDKLLECQDIELILCDLFLQDGIAMDFFHSMKKLAGIYQNTKEPIFRELPFFIFTDNKDLSLEYQYRHEGVSDYITSPVNIPELIRRICYFVEE